MADELMTTQELQELLRIDRTTLYAMLKGGELPGFKVGGRWRFSRRQVEAWIREQQEDLTSLPLRPSPDVLPLETIQSIQSIFAEALDVSSVVTRLDGQPLTQVSNSCAFCDLIRGTLDGREACAASWRSLAGQRERRPRLYPCHAGLLYARGRIEVEDEFVAMVFAGEFVLEGDHKELSSRVRKVATNATVKERELLDALHSVRTLPVERTEVLMDLLGRMGEALSDVGRERLVLLRKLRQIAEVSTI